MKLSDAVEKHQTALIKSELSYYMEEYNWSLAESIVRIDDDNDEDRKAATSKALNQIFIAVGRLAPISDERYQDAFVTGGGKNSVYPKISGQRYKWIQTDHDFIEANEKEK